MGVGVRYSRLLVLSFFLVVMASFSLANYCYQFDGNQSGCQSGNASTLCYWHDEWGYGLCDPVGCNMFSTENVCNNATQAGCAWDSTYSYCHELECWAFDGNSSGCANDTAALGLDCAWSDPYCNENIQGCNYYNSTAECFDTNWCEWNGTGCTDPGGSFGGEGVGCFMFNSEGFCNNITVNATNKSLACTWANNGCTGPTDGLACENINTSSFCNDVPFLDTCCTWQGNSCNATFSTSCWDTMKAPPAGANFCEDYVAIGNETVCNQIAGSPWYMPCSWDNVSNECGFNADDFFQGPDAHFEDIDSKATCEAAGGVWNEETFVDSSGNLQQDEWCEMGFGVSFESCDSSCWACEFNDTGGNWASSAAAKSACENSELGYCQFTADSNAFNGLGWCDIPFELSQSGCGTETNCEDYNYYFNASSDCNADANCKWMTDPADNTTGWCAGANAKSCDQDCGQCHDSTECQTYGGGGNGACQWDANAYLCKNSGGSGGGSSNEICFDGIDNDNDGMIDCGDSNCMSDPFCGGTGGANCGPYSNNDTCLAQSGCAWIEDPHTNSSWCDIEGANCWVYDDNQTACGAETGCTWMTSFMGSSFGICDVNFTAYQGCFQYDQNYTGCGLDTENCTWVSTHGTANDDNGFCDPKPFGCFNNYWGNASGCIADTACTWTNDSFSPQGGWCDPVCFGKNNTACAEDSSCELQAGFCEPTAFAGGGCWQYDGNHTGCIAKSQCSYFNDSFAGNNVSGSEPAGWCNDLSMMHHFEGMEDGMPTIIADDSDGCSLFGYTDVTVENFSSMPASVDVCGVGVKEMDEAYGFGVMMGSLENASLCNGRYVSAPMTGGLGGGGMGGGGSVGNGNETVSIYLYLDTDGKTTGGCTSGNGTAGFDFKFKYEATWDGNVSETKLAYRCISVGGIGDESNWAFAGIGISLWPEKSCSETGAVIMAIDRESLEAEDLFNKTTSMRVLAASSNTTGNESNVLDAAEGYYLQGSVDFIAEDCFGLADLDGDGCLPSEDPDCMLFNKFGFVPFEDCYNGIDDNNDGNTDCNDPMCKYDTYACGGSLVADPNDKEPPQLAFVEVNAMPDAALILLDSFEPSNANVSFYSNDSSCTALNASVADTVYKPWHDLPVDNFTYNTQPIGYPLTANKTYYYKYKLCDITGNCLQSACSNFTTPLDYSSCGIKCKTFIDDMDFTPPSGSSDTDPLGHLEIKYDLGADGSYDYNKTPGSASSQETLNNTGLANIKIENPNSTIDWGIECINGTIPKSTSFNSSAIDINESAGNGMVGMPTSDFKNKFQSDFNCQKIQITVPYNGTGLWHCTNESTSSCTNVTNSSTLITTSANSSTWQVDPSEIGFSFFLSDNNNPAPSTGGTTPGDSTTTPDDTTTPPTTNATCDNDGVCDAGETTDTCPADCPIADDTVEVCNNDGVCDADETNENCPADCPLVNDTVEVCNNDGVCGDGETTDNCPADCPVTTDNDTVAPPVITPDDKSELPILVGVAVIAILGILAVIYLSKGKGKDEEDLL